MQRIPRTIFASAWLLGALEVVLIAAGTIWLLTCPAVFRLYYPALKPSSHIHDAVAVVEWLSSNYRERTLGLTMQEGRFDTQELKHYSDVRRVFKRFPELMAILALAFVLSLLSSTKTWRIIAAAQWRGLLIWSILLAVVGGLALWDWPRFFAWVHHPFFGDVSWRLPDDAYSLVLFPASFWRLAVIAVLVMPVLISGLAGYFLRPFSSPASASAVGSAVLDAPEGSPELRQRSELS